MVAPSMFFPVRRLLLAACASLLALGVGNLLFLSATGPAISPAPGAHAVRGVDGHPQSGGQLAVLGGDVEEGDKGPVNALLLTALLLAASLGITAGWRLAYGRPGTPGAGCPRPSFLPAREDAPFLSVFRL